MNIKIHKGSHNIGGSVTEISTGHINIWRYQGNSISHWPFGIWFLHVPNWGTRYKGVAYGGFSLAWTKGKQNNAKV